MSEESAGMSVSIGKAARIKSVVFPILSFLFCSFSLLLRFFSVLMFRVFPYFLTKQDRKKLYIGRIRSESAKERSTEIQNEKT